VSSANQGAASKKASNYMLYTFVTESGGSTFIEQFHGNHVEDALVAWSHASTAHPHFERTRLVRKDRPTPITGLRGTWCFSGVDKNDVKYLVHIVATRESE
jgi:hypothetical protein